jgi:acyl-coenzyme A thioesterase PaaI-like protein
MSDHLPDLTTWSCFACGQQHPSGLRLRFTAPTPGEIRSEFTVSQDHTGLGNVVHGGIVATVFDEAMVWTLYRWRYAPHVTATMTQRFQGTVASNTPLIVTARITADRGRRRMVEAELYAAAAPDRVLANASGVYVPIAPDGLAQLPPHQRAELDAVFSHFRGLDAASD